MLKDVESSLRVVLGAIPVLKLANGAGRLFEVYVMTLIAERLRASGFNVWIQRSDGTRVNPGDLDRRFVQRGGAPTGIAPATAGANNPSAIGFAKPAGDRWEIWNGVQFKGRSRALHEIDIAIVPGVVGDQLRLTGGVPFGRPRVSVECKDVGTPGSIDEMREFVARMYDLSLIGGHQKHHQRQPPHQWIYPGNCGPSPFYRARLTYWQENRHTFSSVVRRTGFVSGATTVASYYAIGVHGSVTAGSSNALVLANSVATWLAANVP